MKKKENIISEERLKQLLVAEKFIRDHPEIASNIAIKLKSLTIGKKCRLQVSKCPMPDYKLRLIGNTLKQKD